MAAYLIADVSILDPVIYAEYRRLTPPSIAEHGGKFIVRGGAVTPLEGGWCPERLVILEFETVAKAKQWWDSEEYRHARSLRLRSAESRLIIVEGV